MDKLHKLKSLCKCGIMVLINDHKNYYETAKQSLEAGGNVAEDVDEDHMKETMILRDSIISIYAHVETPVGLIVVHHWDLDQALDEAIHEAETYGGKKDEGDNGHPDP